MTEELARTFWQSINSAHADCMLLDVGIRDAIIAKVNKARTCGILLIEAKASVGHGRWEEFIREKLVFSSETAGIYMRFARANPQPITELPDGIGCLKDALIASGALAAPQGHTSQNRSALTWLDHFTSDAMRLIGRVNGQIEKSGGDIEAWPEEQRNAAKSQLQPIVDVYNRL